ncbi:hypothetical protein [Halalkalicoccus tibetensis]|uniref:ABC transporter permease n=1 Tax=Halalkalicoccus tibetensis TaxID=175632 RepID=A0ABD5V0S4_9EURY
MAVRSRRPGPVGAIDVDLRRLHAGWMGLAFPSRRVAMGPVPGNGIPSATTGLVAYGGWAGLGALVVVLLYPLVAVGFAVRAPVRRIGRMATDLGIAGVVALSALLWGGLTAMAYLQFSRWGFVAAAAVVGTFAAAAAVPCSRGGRKAAVLLAYPLGLAAIVLPVLVVGSLPMTLSSASLPGSSVLAVGLLEGSLASIGASDPVPDGTTLGGLAAVGAWFGLVVPLGWMLGCTLALADLVRPSRRGRI